MAIKLNILTLNCWGVFTPFACQLRSERMEAIALAISSASYDIVILEEVWTQSDYEQLCHKIVSRMPFTHYFHSGVFGTGVCIFSKHVICETFHYRFTLNGYAHKIFNGDWFGGKSVGLAKIKIQDFVVNVYGTHLHAQYSEPDNYEAHRLAQSFEMSQFVRHTSEACDVVIVAGDFNYRPDQLGYNVIRFNGNLEDAWLSRRNKCQTEDKETTCDRPDNSFTSSAARKNRPDGVRLDYIMYRANSGINIVCENCCLAMQKVSNESYNYSDHEGVAAVFTVRKNVTAMGRPRETGDIEKHLSDALTAVECGIKKTKSSRVYYVAGCLLSIVALAFISSIKLPLDFSIISVVMEAVHVVVTVHLFFCAWMVIIMINRELNGLIAARKDIDNTLKSLSVYQ